MELRSFVQKLIKQYGLTQNIAPQTYRCGGQLKLNPEQLLVLTELIEASDDATLEELRYLLYQKIGVTISRATMGRMTKVLNMTLKKTLFPRAKGTDRVLNLRYEFWQKIREVCLKNLIFIDESGVNLAMVRLYARSLKASRAWGSKPSKRGKNVSIILSHIGQ